MVGLVSDRRKNQVMTINGCLAVRNVLHRRPRLPEGIESLWAFLVPVLNLETIANTQSKVQLTIIRQESVSVLK